MPSFTPVNPSLAAFNPSNITNGALQSINIASSLDQLKAFRQHAEEVAKTEAARNQMLQAESTKAQILTDHLRAIDDASKAAELAQLEHDRAVQESKTGADIATNASTAQTAGPLANLKIAEANSGVKDINFLNSIRPAVESAKSSAAAAASGAAPYVALATVEDAKTQFQAAKLANAKAIDEFSSLPDDTKRKNALVQSQIDLNNASAQYHIAQGQLNASKANAVGQDPQKAVSAIDLELSRLGKMAAGSGVHDETGAPETLDQYEARVLDPTTGQVKTKFSLMHPLSGSNPVPTSPTGDALLFQKRQLTKAKDFYMSKIAGAALQDAGVQPPPSGAPVVYWKNPSTGKIEPKP